MEFLKGMNTNMIYITALVMAFFITNFMTPISKKIAKKVGAVAEPKAIGVHKKTMPLAGGLAIVTGFIVTALLMAPGMIGFNSMEFFGLIGGSLIITSLGFLDDIYQLSPKIRIFFQVLAALIIVLSGVSIHVLTWPWAEYGVIGLGTWGKILSVIWIVGLTNAVNLIDGLDGLATGVATIASVSLMVISFIFGSPVVVLLAAILAGACLGFLPYNFSPAKIFMGDTGSTFLGFVLAVISIQGLTKSYTVITLVVGMIVLGLPIFDTTFAIVRRVAKRQSIAQGDRGHLHHRLVDKGLSHKKVVLAMYAISGGFGIAGILFALHDFVLATAIVSMILIVWIGDIIYTSKHKKKETPEKNEAEGGH